MAHAPEQDHNHNLDSFTLNNLRLISQLRVVSHSRTRCKESETRQQNYFLSFVPMQVYNTLLDPGWKLDPPPLPTGVCGPVVVVSCVDDGCSWISIITSQGGRCRRFLR
jgi:hypothetical protein